MEQMQNMAVGVEVNMQIRREKLKVEKEEKIDILIKKTEEMMQKITMKVEFFVQNHHDTLFHKNKRLTTMNKFLLIPTTINLKIELQNNMWRSNLLI